ncbi:MAG: hypothetical protein RL247_370 [Actinomycetota bacterium]|jgi:DNA-binding IclR family transcriptional regulator
MSQTVERALGILKLLSTTPRTLTQVAQETGVHKSTALRLLQTLEREDAVRQDSTGRYVLGFGMIRLGESAIEQIDIRGTAHPYLESLAREIGHTVHLAQVIDSRIIYVDKIDGAGTVAMGSRIGLPAELHTAAVAKVILSQMNEVGIKRMLESHPFTKYTNTTILSEDELLRDLSKSRRRGWAEDNGEKEDYINCIALPIFDSSNKVTLGISVTALKATAGIQVLRNMMPLISDTARRISGQLGWKAAVS